jgi:hypothetical protein
MTTDLAGKLDEWEQLIQLKNSADLAVLTQLGVEPLSKEFLQQCAKAEIIELMSEVDVLLSEAEGILSDIGRTDGNRAKRTLYQQRIKLRQQAAEAIARIRLINQALDAGNTKELERLLANNL